MNKRILRETLRICNRELLSHPEYNVGKWYHWTFLVQRDKIIGSATNDSGEPPKQFGYHNRGNWDDFAPKRHSEYNAVMKLKGLLLRNDPWEIVNVRINKHGELRNSCPCPCCYGFIKSMGCDKCHFTTNIGFAKMVI